MNTEVPAPADGVLTEVLVGEGQKVPVGTVLARMASAAEAPFVKTVVQGPRSKVQGPTSGAAPPAAIPPAPLGTRHSALGTRPSAPRFYSPAVRTLAREHGIPPEELDAVAGTGSDGRLTRADLQAYIERRSTAPAARRLALSEPAAGGRVEGLPPAAAAFGTADDVEVVPMDSMRKAIAEHMVRSVQTSPHVTSFFEADMTPIVKFREEQKGAFEAKYGFKLTYLPFVMEAVVRGLGEFPHLNASVQGDKILLKKSIHLGIAVAVGQGLIVPVIRHAERLNLAGLARAANELAAKARAKRLSPDDVQGGTFTLTNPGVHGSLFGTPIISQPQVAILGTGAIKKRVHVFDNDALGVRSMMYLSLSYDHRIIDGALAGQFGSSLVKRLESFQGASL